MLAATALSSLSTVAGAQAVPSYTDIVKRYRAGEFEAAVSALQAMPPWEVQGGVDAMVRAVEKAGGIEPVKAAAMLHTEAAIDGRLRRNARGFDEWTAANKLVRLVQDKDPLSAFVRDWRLLMTAFLQGQQDLFVAMDYARGTWKIVVRQAAGMPGIIPATSASGPLPAGLEGVDHAELRLAVAAIHEMVWTRDRESGTRPRGDLNAAAGELRRAIALQPDLIEARVRLGRVLTLTGRHDEAGRVLADLDNSAGPRFTYLARLFEGTLAERRGDATAAEQRYMSAIDAAPAAQSARVALAHLRHAAGDRAGAATRVRALASDLAARDADDPWLWYLKGMSWRAEGYLAELRNIIHPSSAR